MTKDPSRDRAILCRYNPSEVGQYVLHVKWSGEHVPGSPFPVSIVDTFQELEALRNQGSFGGILDEYAGSILSGSGGEGRQGGNDRTSTFNGDGLIFTEDDDNYWSESYSDSNTSFVSRMFVFVIGKRIAANR